MKPIIHRVQPFDTDDFRSVGETYNRAIDKLDASNNDWIMLLDWDTTILTKDTYKLIDRTIKNAPENTGVIGPLTNRLGMTNQLHNGEFNNNFDIRRHREIAYTLSGGLNRTRSVAGFFMLFPYSRWIEVDFFNHNRFFDTAFCNALNDLGYQNYIATYIYVFHQYRPWKSEIVSAHQSYEHLKTDK